MEDPRLLEALTLTQHGNDEILDRYAEAVEECCKQCTLQRLLFELLAADPMYVASLAISMIDREYDRRKQA